MNGHTICHTPELVAGSKLPGVHVQILSGYALHAPCTCSPWQWLNEAYHKRNMYKMAGDPREKVFKLGPNAAYGALAQHVGNPKYRSLLLAGLITSWTRATLLDSIRSNPSIVCVATDSAWATQPLSLDFGENLGQWADEGTADNVWIIQPGLAYSEDNLTVSKTRGVPVAAMNAEQGSGLTAWESLIDQFKQKWDTKETVCCSITSTRYAGIGTAKMLRSATASGRWSTQERLIRFGSDKRPHWSTKPTAPLWRASWPVDVGYDIHLADRTLYAAELAELQDSPYVDDDLTMVVANLGE